MNRTRTPYIIVTLVALVLIAVVVGISLHLHQTKQLPVTVSPTSTTQAPSEATPITVSITTTSTSCKKMDILSPDGSRATVDSSGLASGIQVSKLDLQTLFAIDSSNSGAICLAAVSIPGQPVVFNANSTASALIFMTPGLNTPNLATAKTRLTTITTLSCYSDFLNYLKQQLISHPYSTLDNDSTYSNLLSTCQTQISQAVGLAS